MSTATGTSLTDEPTRQQQDLLASWKAIALLRMPYMAPLVCALRPRNAPGLGTFAVDRHWRMYVDFDAVQQHGELWCAESLLHEVGHLFNRHFARALAKGLTDADGHPVGGPALQQAWAVATDLSINDDLTDAGCTTFAADRMVPAALSLPDHLPAESYFDLLAAKTPPRAANPDRGGTCPACQQSSAPSAQGPARPAAAPTCVSCGQPAPPAVGCGSGAGNAASAWEQPGTAADHGVDPDEQHVVLAATATLVAQAAAKAPGSVPGRWEQAAASLLAPSVVPWHRVLAPALRKGIGSRSGADEQTWTRPNRRKRDVRFAGGRVVFPGSHSPQPVVVVVRDTSGSMGADDLARVSSEVEGIARKAGVRDENLLVMDVDAQAYQVRRYTGARVLQQAHGRGGTDMRVGIQAAAALVPHPSVVVVITDGFTPWPQVPTRGVRVVACIVGPDAAAAAEAVPGFIRTVVANEAVSQPV